MRSICHFYEIAKNALLINQGDNKLTWAVIFAQTK